ncbi:uncharacterized protein LOC129587995 [Paramacrobiotus metropolitanus]|uniref:uncharacterized protein LOC129587995 n=1 Tax=Paramacrobiotus metropolitanus TaxID=2943436 RepID=UPI0024463DAA|nr:uncharacterized protein LOC129587995 [Paramacrobiotus metropolitanus]
MTAVDRVNTDALIGSVRSSMLITMGSQATLALIAGILIHSLAPTLIEETIALGIWFLGGLMYVFVVGAAVWAYRLHTTRHLIVAPPSDLDAILQFDSGQDTRKKTILRHFRGYTYSCCGLLAVGSFLAALSDLPNAINAERLDLLKWPIIFGLVAFGPLLIFFIYNMLAGNRYEERMKSRSVFEGERRRGLAAVDGDGPVRFEGLPAIGAPTESADQALDTVLRNN